MKKYIFDSYQNIGNNSDIDIYTILFHKYRNYVQTEAT